MKTKCINVENHRICEVTEQLSLGVIIAILLDRFDIALDLLVDVRGVLWGGQEAQTERNKKLTGGEHIPEGGDGWRATLPSFLPMRVSFLAPRLRSSPTPFTPLPTFFIKPDMS